MGRETGCQPFPPSWVCQALFMQRTSERKLLPISELPSVFVTTSNL